MLPFVGADRLALVDELFKVYGCLSESGPRWVSLEATTGWGKTRIIQEFYRKLAASQEAPGYWPASIEDNLTLTDSALLDRRRSALYPEVFQVPDGAMPGWMWWGISCHRGTGGVRVQSIADELTQFAAHEDALNGAWKSNAKFRQRFGASVRKHGSTVGESAANEAVGQVAGLASMAFPGLGMVVSLTLHAIMAAAEGRHAGGKDLLDATGGARADLVDTLAPALAQIGRVLPVVIVVENLHEADASLAALLGRLMRTEGAAILLLTSSWPDLLDQQDRPCSELLAAAPEGTLRRWQQPMVAGSPDGHLTMMEEADRESLVGALLPAANSGVVAALARRYAIPLALEIVSALPATLGAVADGLDPHDWTAKLPNDLGALYRLAFLALSSATRERLMLAALAAKPGGGLPAELWDENLLSFAALAYADALSATAEPVRQAATVTTDVRGWVEHVDVALRRFLEPAQLDVAYDEAKDRHASYLSKFYAALAAMVTIGDASRACLRSCGTR